MTAAGGWRSRIPPGQPVRALAEGARRREDGSLAEVTLTFAARDVPALGVRAYQVVPAGDGEGPSGWQQVAAVGEGGPYAIENGRYVVTADPARGGTVSISDKRTRACVLAGPGNELVIQDEYAQHPRHGEGPWHLSPKGPGTGSSSVPASVRVERCPAGSRLVASFTLDGLDVIQETILWEDAERVEFRTHVDSYREHDRMLRVRFPADVPGGLPVYQTATAVIGRPFGVVDVDSADHWYTLDNPAHLWFGLGSAARVRTGDGVAQAIGVAEVVCPDGPAGWPEPGLRGVIRDLMTALAAAGVTATCSQADGPRYGGIDADSNLPDVRIALGGPEANGFTSEVLAAAGPGYAKALAARLAACRTARLWVPAARSREDAFGPDADVRGPADLPVLIVAGADPGELAAAVTALAGDLADAVVDAGEVADAGGAGPGGEVRPVPLADRSVALFNRGTPSCVVTPDGTLHMSLMRSCSAWPSRIWIDGDPRTAPDGSSFAWQHWSHTFEYALASGPGDWRTAGFNAQSEQYTHDLVTEVSRGWPADSGSSLLTVEPANVTLSTLKPRGNPLASELSIADAAPGDAAAEATVTVRLRETAGRPTTARVRLAQPISAAWLTDLLEEADGDAVPLVDGAAVVDMPAFGTTTLAVRTGRRPAGYARMPLIEPVYARYWLHGQGPAPAGNLPVAVHFSPARAALPDPSQADSLTLTVGCGPEPVSGVVELVVPDGITVTADRDLRYELAARRVRGLGPDRAGGAGHRPGPLFRGRPDQGLPSSPDRGHGHDRGRRAPLARSGAAARGSPGADAGRLQRGGGRGRPGRDHPRAAAGAGRTRRASGQPDQPPGVGAARRGSAGVTVGHLGDALPRRARLQHHAQPAGDVAVRGHRAGHGPARGWLVGPGEGHVLRPGPVFRRDAGHSHPRLVATTLQANKVR